MYRSAKHTTKLWGLVSRSSKSEVKWFAFAMRHTNCIKNKVIKYKSESKVDSILYKGVASKSSYFTVSNSYHRTYPFSSRRNKNSAQAHCVPKKFEIAALFSMHTAEQVCIFKLEYCGSNRPLNITESPTDSKMKFHWNIDITWIFGSEFKICWEESVSKANSINFKHLLSTPALRVFLFATTCYRTTYEEL